MRIAKYTNDDHGEHDAGRLRTRSQATQVGSLEEMRPGVRVRRQRGARAAGSMRAERLGRGCAGGLERIRAGDRDQRLGRAVRRRSDRARVPRPLRTTGTRSSSAAISASRASAGAEPAERAAADAIGPRRQDRRDGRGRGRRRRRRRCRPMSCTRRRPDLRVLVTRQLGEPRRPPAVRCRAAPCRRRRGARRPRHGGGDERLDRLDGAEAAEAPGGRRRARRARGSSSSADERRSDPLRTACRRARTPRSARFHAEVALQQAKLRVDARRSTRSRRRCGSRDARVS